MDPFSPPLTQNFFLNENHNSFLMMTTGVGGLDGWGMGGLEVGCVCGLGWMEDKEKSSISTHLPTLFFSSPHHDLRNCKPTLKK